LTIYALQKLIREINRDPATRDEFFATPETVAARFDLSPDERSALVARDYGRLYAFGVHGLLLRPFSILHKVSEPDYLRAIRGQE
jgi:hypothetical protein